MSEPTKEEKLAFLEAIKDFIGSLITTKQVDMLYAIRADIENAPEGGEDEIWASLVGVTFRCSQCGNEIEATLQNTVNPTPPDEGKNPYPIGQDEFGEVKVHGPDSDQGEGDIDAQIDEYFMDIIQDLENVKAGNRPIESAYETIHITIQQIKERLQAQAKPKVSEPLRVSRESVDFAYKMVADGIWGVQRFYQWLKELGVEVEDE